MKKILKLLGLSKKEPESTEDNIAYADASHDPGNNKQKSGPTLIKRRSNNRPEITPPKMNYDAAKHMFEDTEFIKSQIMRCMETVSQMSLFDLRGAVAERIAISPKVARRLLVDQDIKDKIDAALESLHSQRRIYPKDRGIWTTEVPVSLLGTQIREGWYRINDPMDAIKWIQQEFTPDEFEVFCAQALNFYGKGTVKVTAKGPMGGDGGIDGIGKLFLSYNANDPGIDIVFQAKRYALEHTVSPKYIREFYGAMRLKSIRHGFMITTGKFDQEARRIAKEFGKDFEDEKGRQIELVDQNALIEMMLIKKENRQKYGLWEYETKRFCLNPVILRCAVGRK